MSKEIILLPQKDAANNLFHKGDFIAFSGENNKTAEYGMIIAKIVGIPSDKNYVECERFKVDYINGNPTIKKVKIKKNYGKFIVVNPDNDIKKLFEMSDDQLDNFCHTIAHWLHKGLYV